MIYNNKNAVFNYPVFTNNSNSYNSQDFILSIKDVKQDNETNEIFYEIQIDSLFIKGLIESKKVAMICVIQSKDNQYYMIDQMKGKIVVPKTQLSLKRSTNIQILLKATEDIDFINCFELTPTFNSVKDEIKIPKNNLVGYSNVEILSGVEVNSVELFERKINRDLNVPFKVTLTENNIVLNFQDSKYLLDQFSRPNALNNMYIYVGLSRALQNFIINNRILSEEGYDDLAIEMDQVDQSGLSVLDQKLYGLLINKNIELLEFSTIDEPVNQIAPEIIDSFVNEVLRGRENEN